MNAPDPRPEHDPRARQRPFKLYFVTVRMSAGERWPYEYIATRIVRAQDPDGAACEALWVEVKRAAGQLEAGGPAHAPLGVVRVRAVLDGRVSS